MSEHDLAQVRIAENRAAIDSQQEAMQALQARSSRIDGHGRRSDKLTVESFAEHSREVEWLQTRVSEHDVAQARIAQDELGNHLDKLMVESCAELSREMERLQTRVSEHDVAQDRVAEICAAVDTHHEAVQALQSRPSYIGSVRVTSRSGSSSRLRRVRTRLSLASRPRTRPLPQRMVALERG